MPAQTTPFKAAGSTLGYKLTSGGTDYLPVGQLTSLDPGSTEIDEIDTTLLAASAMSSIPAIPDNGEVTFKSFYVPGDPAIEALEALAATPAVIYWQIQLPNGSSATTGTAFQFRAWLKSLKRNTLDVKSTPTCDVSLRVTEGVTIVPAT